MKVHHLNCLTMCPPLGRLMVNDRGTLIAHCLLVETGDGLLLVDTGLGLEDLRDAKKRLGRGFLMFARPDRDPAQCAASQVERLGFRRSDVRNIIPTHLDIDHAGGIADFPQAQVHIYRPELEAARARKTRFEKRRYLPHQWRDAHFVPHEPNGQGESWFGFEAVRPLDAHGDVLIVPLVGHTRGHCGVAVKDDAGWILHCGDAYFHASEMSDTPRGTAGLNAFQWLDDMDRAARKQNQARLRQLAREHAHEVRVFCAHDPAEFDAFLA